MPDDLNRREQFLLEQERRPLGMAQRTSNRLDQSFSAASMEAADNLLSKALRRLEEGNQERAQAFIQRALSLPYDEHEELHPASWSAHMALFIPLTDDFEESPAGDQGWLDRAEALLGLVGPAADAEIRRCLRVVLTEADGLSAAGIRRLKALTAGVVADAEPFADVPEDQASRVKAVSEVLTAVIEHRKLPANSLG